MDKNFKNHLVTTLAGVLLGIGLFWITGEMPDSPVIRNHNGLSSTLLGLTLASNPDEIYEIIGGPENEEFMVYTEQFKSILLYELVFIVLYVVFFLQMIGFAYRNEKPGISMVFLSVVVVISALFDVGENFQLQTILDSTSSHKMEDPIFYMQYLTKGKWFLAFAVSAILSMKFWLNEKGLILKLFSIIMMSSFLFYLSHFIRMNLIELGILFMVIGFFLFWIYSLLIIFLSKNT